MNITAFAQYAGVSKAAVSRYFNGGYLSAEKRAQIAAAVEATGYRPSMQAQMLRTRRTRQIEVIMPRLSSESCARMVEGISRVLDDQNYQLLLINTANDNTREVRALDTLRHDTVDGIILIATMFTPEHHAVLQSLHVPVVIVGQQYPGFSCVFHDDFGAAQAATAHMLQKGRRKPGYLGVTLLDKAVGLALDDGFDYYAPQSFAAADGRRIQFGWMGMPDADYTNPTVEYGWQHCLTLPRVLTQDGNGCLLQAPAAELNALRGEARQPADGETVETDPCFDLTASPAGDFALTIANGLTLTYTEADRTCTLRFTDAAIAAGRTERKAVLDAPCRSLRVVGDASSLEIFLNDGAAVLSTRYYPAAGKVAVQLCGAGSTLYSLSI